MRQVKIGLALGSGAAKGWAHIGVIKALERAGLQIDVVAGCSVGALVGSAYVNQRLPLMEKWVCSFSYWDVIRLMDFSWRRGGLLRGERVFNHIHRIIPHETIQECGKPFGVVATNLSTGRELWLTEGDLQRAVRASCSMPGLLAPVSYNGYWLVDGAVVNPVPVSLTRALGADIVIAVDLQHDAHLMQQDLLSATPPPDERRATESDDWRSRIRQRLLGVTQRRVNQTPGAMEVMTTSIQMLENRVKRHRMAGDPPDILIQPFCPQISTLDFHRAGEAIAAGNIAVEKKMDEILPLIRNI